MTELGLLFHAFITSSSSKVLRTLALTILTLLGRNKMKITTFLEGAIVLAICTIVMAVIRAYFTTSSVEYEKSKVAPNCFSKVSQLRKILMFPGIEVSMI